MIVPKGEANKLFYKISYFCSKNNQIKSETIILHDHHLSLDLDVPIECKYENIMFKLNRHENSFENQEYYMEWEINVNKLEDISFIEDFYENIKVNTRKLIVYTTDYGIWSVFYEKNKRSIKSVSLPESVDIVEDFQKFLNSKHIYDNLQINHSRIYLLEGISGTGKTSIIHALASEYNYNIAYLDLKSCQSETEFRKLFISVPKNTFILVEDIDSLFEQRNSATLIGFSSWINILDGITSQNNSIIFLTTNHINKIDDAIKRRCDRIYKFGYINWKQLLQFGISENDAKYYTKFKTTVNIVLKFMLTYKDKSEFETFNNNYKKDRYETIYT